MDERILYSTGLCGRAICQIPDGLTLVVSLAGASIEISDFGAEVNSSDPLNYSVFTMQVQLGRSTISRGITVSFHLRCYSAPVFIVSH